MLVDCQLVCFALVVAIKVTAMVAIVACAATSLMWDTQNMSLLAYYLVWLWLSQYDQYIRYSGWFQLMMVVCRELECLLLDYMQGYNGSSSSIALGSAHKVGLVLKVPTMD